MCMQDEPPWNADALSENTTPRPTRPRTYLLSGSVPAPRVAASVALAVIGEMLSDAENAFAKAFTSRTYELAAQRIAILRDARERIAKAEAEYADGTVRG